MDGYEIRSAAVAADIPCITTVPGRRGRRDGHRGADPRRDDGPTRCRSCTPPCAGTAASRDRPLVESGDRGDPVTCYERVAGPVLFRLGGGDAEAAHELDPARGWPGCPRRAGALAGSRRRAGRRGRRRATVFGVALPEPGRARRRDGQGRRGAAGLAGARLRLRRGRHGHLARRSRATSGRGCSGCARAEAIVNRMGFNNAGAAALAGRLARAARRPAAGCRWGSASASRR